MPTQYIGTELHSKGIIYSKPSVLNRVFLIYKLAYAAHDATVNIKVSAITGIQESSVYNFNLYPNPVSEIATVDVPDNFTEVGVVRLFDLTGREIKKLNFSSDSRSFDFSDVSKGVYVLKLSIQGKNFEQKVVKL